MTKQTLTKYLKHDSKIMGILLGRLNELERWNAALRDCLSKEPLLIEHCQIVNLSGTSLIAIADSPHWLTRIRFHIPELLPQLRQYPGLEHIRALCCKVRPQYPRKTTHIKRTPQKLSIATANRVKADAQKLTDDKLRAIMEKIAQYSETSDEK